jgi:hypothetical protein
MWCASYHTCLTYFHVLIECISDVLVWCRQGELPDPKSRSLEKEVEDFVKNVNKLPRYAFMTFTATQYIVPLTLT